MKIFIFLFTQINNIAYKIYTNQNRSIPSSVLTALGRFTRLFFIIQTCFFLFEKIVWNDTFPHFGDLIVFIYLAAEFAAIVYLFFFYKKRDSDVVYIKPTTLRWIKLIKKSEAMTLAKEHDGFCSIETYCTTKRIWDVNGENAYVGQEMQVSSKILALWVEHITNENESYALIKCLIDNN